MVEGKARLSMDLTESPVPPVKIVTVDTSTTVYHLTSPTGNL
jgi:hypothetical protein